MGPREALFVKLLWPLVWLLLKNYAIWSYIVLRVVCLQHRSLYGLVSSYLANDNNLVSDRGRCLLRSSSERTRVVLRTSKQFWWQKLCCCWSTCVKRFGTVLSARLNRSPCYLQRLRKCRDIIIIIIIIVVVVVTGQQLRTIQKHNKHILFFTSRPRRIVTACYLRLTNTRTYWLTSYLLTNMAN